MLDKQHVLQVLKEYEKLEDRAHEIFDIVRAYSRTYANGSVGAVSLELASEQIFFHLYERGMNDWSEWIPLRLLWETDEGVAAGAKDHQRRYEKAEAEKEEKLAAQKKERERQEYLRLQSIYGTK